MIDAIRRLRRDERGSYVIEFAFLVLPMFVILFGSIEFGYRAYANAQMEGILRKVSRLSGTGTIVGDTSTCATPNNCTDAEVVERLRAYVEDSIEGVPNPTVVATVKSYDEFTSVQQPEAIQRATANAGATGGPLPGDCWTEANGTGVWEADIGLTGTGNSEDVVYFEVSVSYENLFDLTSFLTNSDTTTLSSSTTIRNEPYGVAAANTPYTRCVAADGTFYDA